MSNTITDRRNEAGDVDYYCPNSHRVHGDNILWRVNGAGKKNPSCRECKRIYRADFRRKQGELGVREERMRQRRNNFTAPVYDSNGNALSLEDYLGAEKRNVPWNLLRPSPGASGAFDAFHEALTFTDVPCRGKWDEFTEYADPRSAFADEVEDRAPMPGAQRARMMCAGCPLYKLCGEYAASDKPDIGIWAGQRWLGGKIVK